MSSNSTTLYGGVFVSAFAGATLLWALQAEQTPSLFNHSSICRAAISMVFGRPTSIISVVSASGDEILTSYVRPNDGSVWRNRCRIGNGSLIWATETGRWRTHSADERIAFRFTDNGRVMEMKLTHDDGSGSTQRFTLNELQAGAI